MAWSKPTFSGYGSFLPNDSSEAAPVQYLLKVATATSDGYADEVVDLKIAYRAPADFDEFDADQVAADAVICKWHVWDSGEGIFPPVLNSGIREPGGTIWKIMKFKRTVRDNCYSCLCVKDVEP